MKTNINYWCSRFIGSNFLKHLSNQDYDIYGIDFDIIKNNDERIF